MRYVACRTMLGRDTNVAHVILDMFIANHIENIIDHAHLDQ